MAEMLIIDLLTVSSLIGDTSEFPSAEPSLDLTTYSFLFDRKTLSAMFESSPSLSQIERLLLLLIALLDSSAAAACGLSDRFDCYRNTLSVS